MDHTRPRPLRGVIIAMVIPLDQDLNLANPVRGLKCALSLSGICSDHLTLPLRPYSPEERDEVQRYLRTLDVLKEPA